MSKKVKAVIGVLCAVVVVLAGLLIYTQVDKNNYKRYKNIISQEEVEQTLFGQPISAERDGEYRTLRKLRQREETATIL